MKKFIIFLAICSLVIHSCEDVIELDLPNQDPQLVIEASINWQKGTSGNDQRIKLSLTAPFFDAEIPPATGATVLIRNGANEIFEFNEQEPGTYVNTNFIPELNSEYQLDIRYNNEIYQGTETLKEVSSIDFIEQDSGGGFLGEDIEIKAYYTDPANEENFYLYRFSNTTQQELELEVYSDEFTNGNQIFAYYSTDEINPGDQVLVTTYGVSRQFHDYFFLLRQQTDDENGDPFEVQPAVLRGNCVNTTNPENFPLGYFRLSQTDSVTYIVE